jgi:NTP pyrophosphatase (non-canonical NTP hydrolase)
LATLTELQKRLREFDRHRGWDKDPHEVNFICLTSEIGELSKEIIDVWIETGKLIKTGINYKKARNKVLAERKERIAEEIADCIIYLLKVANYPSKSMSAKQLT